MTEAPVAVRGRHALSPIQRALYASQQRHPRSPLQNMVRLMHIDGPVEPDRLAHAFAEVVAASDVLRTQIHTEGRQETVVRLGDEPAATEIVEVPRADAERWAARRAADILPIGRRAYDSAVLVHEDGTASWYLALHHCVTDATSSSLVSSLTAAAYAGDLPAIGSYYDWASRLGDAGAAVDRAERYWAERSTAHRVGHLYERHRPATPSSTRIPVAIDDDLAGALDELLQGAFRSFSTDLSWTTTLLTATAVFLHRVTGASTFALGLPVHNRSRPEARDLLGPLVEVFPVDVAIEPDDTFLTLHARLARSMNQTLRHAVPGTAPAGTDIEAVVNVIPEAELDRFGPFPASTVRIHAGASDSNHLVRVQLTRYGGLDLSLDVNDAAVAADRRTHTAGHFRTVLKALADHPDQRLGAFALVQDDERRVLESWGVGPDPAPGEHVVDQLQRVLEAGTDIALQDGERSWTGAELWRWVREVASGIQAEGVAPGVRVALEMERSAETVVGILATLVAGGSYVPIDPRQPIERRSRLIERAGCVVTLRAVAPPAGGDATVEPVERALDDEAYLLFTSGSTGEPKGVPITHRGLAGYLAFATDSYLSTGERPVVPLFTALTFDLTVTSLFLPLLAGGRMIVIGGDGPGAVRAVAERTEVTWCKATPSHLEMLTRLLPDDHGLRTLVVGGEAFGVPLLQRLLRRNPALRVYNEYGPTEAVVGCMIHEASVDEFPGCPDVPIGRPAPGVHLRVLDAHGHLVPRGAVGELFIARVGLTEGYLDGDDGAFVEMDGQRWYRSGDLVRMLDDRTLVYLRRVDEQLKVGGIRLDPSEIEAALVEHPAVRRAAVRYWSHRHQTPSHHCTRCGLADNVPGVVFDDAGVCDRCHAFDAVESQAQAWFKGPDDLVALRDEARRDRTGPYDCIALLSGGKDSTYALYQLVRLGFDVYALTLDNGFISAEAKENIGRSIADLGIEHEFATTDAMAEIFRDSLDRHSNVCHGCFKTIYTLATHRAVELGAPLVITGLSRGQLFETRLIPAQFAEGRFDPDAIDEAVVAARKAYHRSDDAVTRLLDNGVFADDSLFERIRYVDFYRYLDVELSEMLRFLGDEAPWVRPADTGRSTNCRINAAGIHTHLLEQGFHNYAEPYAWDVRLGHKLRDEALAELDDRDDADEVAAMLDEVGYRPRKRETLTAWVEVEPDASPPTPAGLRAHLSALLPAHAVPTAFVVTSELPMTSNGKLDTEALPAPDRVHRSTPAMMVEPTSALERTIVEIWERQLGVEPISVDDDFFALGGDSLGALEMTMALGDALGVNVPDEVAFANATPRSLAVAVAHHLSHDEEAGRAAPDPGAGGSPPVLSAGERSMLYEHELRPDDPRYNQGRLYRIDGAVDHVRLRDAVAAVVRRHVPLHWTYGNPRRELTAEAAVHVDHGAIESWAEVQQRVAALHRAPFDLEHGPLLRVGHYEMGPEATALALATHHVSTDAGSFERLWAEIEAAYHGDDLPTLSISYADHSAWQAAGRDDAAAAYWLESARPVRRMALELPDPDEPDGLRERIAGVRAGELHAAVGSSPFAAVLASLALVLRRYTGSDEVTLGALVSTRDHPEADHLIGYYLNTLPLNVDADVDATLGELRATWADTLARGLTHRTYPFADMIADRRRAGIPDAAPQVLVALQDLGSLAFGRHGVEQEILYTGASVADATFFVQVRGDDVVLAIEHRGAAVDGATADRLLADLDAVLASLLRHPGDLVAQALLPSQSDGVLTGPPAPAAPHVLEPMAGFGRSKPDAAAVVCGSATLSWAELDRWSAAAAGALLDAGVAPGDRVIVCRHRSVELVVAILAALRAGATYVPVDPSYPVPRNQAIIDAAGAVAMIGGPESSELRCEAGRVALPPCPEVDPDVTLPAPDIDSTAYVIFTSGSTGEPRGVPVRHRELAHSNAARGVAYPEAPDRYLLLSSVAFDSSVAGLFWTLTTGGTLVLPTEAEVHDVDALVDLFAVARVTHTLLVPSLYRGLLRCAASDARWPRQVIVAGESCPREVVDAHFVAHPDTRLANEYGPTEATVWSTVHHLDAAESRHVPIGRPVAGTWAAVVDGRGQPCPAGVVGELVVGGLTVGLGYDRVESSRFRETAPHGPGRAFFTGDRAAVVDGVLHFRGRVDDQLNIGGVRIEPAEIEAVLEEVPGIEAAVVVARDLRRLDERMATASTTDLADAMRAAAVAEDPAAALLAHLADPTGATLIAHLETDDDLLVDDARTAARRGLPPTSCPAVYLAHRRLPRSPNGKVDRAAIGQLPVATPVETSLPSDRDIGDLDGMLTLWREVLGRPELGPDDDFFDAGGDSLLALELLLRVERAHGVRPRVSVLFEARTPRALHVALGLDGSTAPDGEDRAIVLQEGSRGEPPLWLVPGAGGVLLVFERLVALLDPGLRILGVEYPGTNGEGAPAETVEAIGEHYHRAVLAAQPEGPYRLLGYSVGGLVAIDVVRRLRADGHTVEFVGAVEAGLPDAGDRRNRREKIVDDWRDTGAAGVAGRLTTAVRTRVRALPGNLRDRARDGFENFAVDRFGLRPSDRFVFDRMIATSTDAGLRYRPSPVDTAVVVYLGEDGDARWVDAMTTAWSEVAAGGLRVVMVPGSHHEGTMLTHPNVVALAASVEAALAGDDRASA